MTETSFSWNFDAGTLTDEAAKSLCDPIQGRSTGGYGLPLTACLPGSDESEVDSNWLSHRAPGRLDGETERHLGDTQQKV